MRHCHIRGSSQKFIPLLGKPLIVIVVVLVKVPVQGSLFCVDHKPTARRVKIRLRGCYPPVYIHCRRIRMDTNPLVEGAIFECPPVDVRSECDVWSTLYGEGRGLRHTTWLVRNP